MSVAAGTVLIPMVFAVSRDSVVGIATRSLRADGLDGAGIADPSGRALAGITGSNPAGGMDICVVCCTVKTKGKV
jgi:hypothetical protein